jgi:hypothetical protein
VTFTATTALPYENLARATAALRAELGYQLVDAGNDELPDWDTLVVTGPLELTDHRGRTWFKYVATVESRPARP